MKVALGQAVKFIHGQERPSFLSKAEVRFTTRMCQELPFSSMIGLFAFTIRKNGMLR